jgi:uncharacterized protein
MATTEAGDTVLGDAILARLTAFSTALRRAGIPTTQAGTLDAVRALGAIDLAERRQVREALAAVSLTSGAQRPTFDALFDLFLPPRTGTREWSDPSADLDPPGGRSDLEGTTGSTPGDAPAPPVDAEAFVEQLLLRLLEGDEEEVVRLAREAVDRFGRLPGSPGSAGDAQGERGWFRYRVLRAIDPTSILEQMLQRSGGGPSDLTPSPRCSCASRATTWRPASAARPGDRRGGAAAGRGGP